MHAAVAQDQQLAVDRAVEGERLREIGKRGGDLFTGARVESRDTLALSLARDRLHADTVPFPFGGEVRWIERGKILRFDRMAEHHRVKRRRIDADRFFGAAFHPGEQLRVGRRETGPDQLDLVRDFVAERRDRGFREPRRHADPQRPSDELEQSPAAGLIERIEPGGKLRGEFGFAERGEGGDDVGEARTLRTLSP